MTTIIEIEHKWILSKKPSVKANSYVEIYQGYIGEQSEVRIRKKIKKNNVDFVITRKEGIGLSRIEYEEPITKQVFEILKPLVKADLHKIRYIYIINGKKWELDEYLEKLSGLFTLELEVPTENYKFEIPDFLKSLIIKEVTGDINYLNASLSRLKDLSELKEQ